MWPGFDAGHMPNSYASPVIVLLYFIPELRASLLREQFNLRNFEKSNNDPNTPHQVGALSAELGFVFNQIDSLSNNALLAENNIDVGAFNPVNFLASFALLPEAAALALLDGSTTAVRLPRRIEAFYRFLIHHLNQEIEVETPTKNTPTKNMAIKNQHMYGSGGGGSGGGSGSSSSR